MKKERQGRFLGLLGFLLIALYFAPVQAQAQQNEQAVSGIVTDGGGDEPLPGANIQVKGTTIGTSTDQEGRYSLVPPSLNDTLIASFVGYERQEIPIDGRTRIDIELMPATVSGQEVVVVGYGTQEVESVTGSISQVPGSAVEDLPVADVAEALQGAAPNLTIQQPSGEPGAGLNINIRGISTMNNNDPLVVIDGVAGGSLSDLNPNNIESISVLKDAGSAAIYGSRAANGVILVTTKSGTRNTEPTVTFSSQVGLNDPNIRYEPVDGYINAILRNQALVNAGNSPVYSPEEIRTLQQEGDIEWFMDTIFQEALQQDYNLAISGGDENTTYRASGRYFDQGNNLVGDYGMRRYNFRINVNTDYGRFNVDSRLALQRSNIRNHTASTGFLIADAKRTPPYYNYRMRDDSTGRYLLNDVLGEFNPLGELERGGTSQSTNDVYTGVLQLGYDITDQLEARGNLSAVIRSNESLLAVKQVPYYSSPTASEPANISGSDRNTNNDNYSSLLLNPSFVLDYSDVYGDDHGVGFLLGVSSESFRSESNGIHLIYTDPDLNIPVSETEIQNSSYTTLETRSENRLHSLFGRVEYSYASRYFTEFDFRYDGSSRFAAPNRWGFFPSVSAAWNISEESFMERYDNIGLLKLRASYGTLGNQSVSDYQYQTSYFTYSNAYGFNNSSVAGTGFEFANEDLQWEETSTLNVGLDAEFFDNRLNASLDLYQKVTTDILLTPTVPGTYGGAVPDYNAGSMRNRGWEVSLGYNTSGYGVNHSFDFNIADSWNVVTDFRGEEQISSADQIQRIIREGVPFNSYYGYKVDGFFQNPQEVTEGPLPIGVTVQPGDVRYVDRNEDGVIDDEDRFVLGNAFPRLTFGLQYGLDWGNLDLSLFVQGVGQRTMFLRGENVEPFHANYAYTMYTHQTDFWTPTNPDARWPRLTTPGSASNSNNYQVSSDLYAFDASYIRLRNVRVGYTLPERFSLGAERVNLYLNAQNLYTLSNMDFLNPESTEFSNDMTAGGSNSGRSYPDIRYYGFGLRLTL